MIGLIFGGLLKRLSEALSAVLGFVTRNPLLAALIVSLCLSAFMWHGKSVATNQRDQCQTARKADRQAYIDAEAESAAKAIAALRAQEALYQTKAKEADNAYNLDLASARSAADRYRASHRVPAIIVGRSPSSATAGTTGHDSGIPASAAADSDMVAVSNADFNACTGAVIYARAAYDWAKGLNAL